MHTPRRWMLLGLMATAATLLAPAPGNAQQAPTQEERLQGLLKRFPEADANKDGRLTRDEARAYQQKMRGGAARSEQREQLRKPTHADVAYGEHERQVFDFYQAESNQPTPLLVYIHGGGFVGGSKRSLNPQVLEMALEDGISVAALHYRFVDGKEVIFPTPQHDCARALQFIRSKAKEWNLAPTRVACFGGSAGAGISMWLGFHDDLADPQSDDPIERYSTRIQAIGTLGGQTTYDPIKIKELIGGRAWEHPSIFKVYGITTTEEALNPSEELQKLYDEASAITHLSADDPPIFMLYSEADGPLPDDARPGQGIHHPNFGRLLKEEMDKLGIESQFVYVGGRPEGNPLADMYEFLKRYMGGIVESPASKP